MEAHILRTLSECQNGTVVATWEEFWLDISRSMDSLDYFSFILIEVPDWPFKYNQPCFLAITGKKGLIRYIGDKNI